MSLESARAVRHRRIAEAQRLEAKRVALVDRLAGRDAVERARLEAMTYGQVVCELYRYAPTLPGVVLSETSGPEADGFS